MSYDRAPVSTGVPESSPTRTETAAVPLFSQGCAAEPYPWYREARQRFGALCPGLLGPNVPATVVFGYETALHILRNPEQFPADPRGWQQDASAECPMRPILEYRPDARRSAGKEHQRYRRAHVAALEAVDQHAVLAAVEQIAVGLVNTFCGHGAADLRAEFATPLAFQVINHLLGIDANVAERVVPAVSASLEANDPQGIDAARGELGAVLLEVIRQKAAAPAQDMVSRLIVDPAGLSEQELVCQVALLYEMGIEPMVSLILNALRSMFTEVHLNSMLGGAVGTRDALDAVLFNDPPIPNGCITFPPRAQLVNNSWLWEHQPVVISFAACNQDPAVRRTSDTDTGVRGGNRSHLAWGLGDHACPASDIAMLVANAAIDQLVHALPDIALAVPAEQLRWQPNPFHRVLVSLPVVFAPAPPLPF